MTKNIKTIYERVDEYRKIVTDIRRRHKLPESGNIEDAIYDSKDALRYDRALKKLRTYQKIACHMGGA